MYTVSTALFGNYRNGEYLQFMKNVVAIYGNYDTNALLLQARLQTLADATTALDEVFMASTAHELTPELQVLDIRRDKALMGIKIHLNSYSYSEEIELVKAASNLMTNYLSHGDRIDKLSYQQGTAVIDALLTDWRDNPTLLAAVNTLSLTTWVGLLAQLNKAFNEKYITRAKTLLKPGQVDQKRTEMRSAYDEIIFDTVAHSRVATDKTEYFAIIDDLNGLISNYNTSVTMRHSFATCIKPSSRGVLRPKIFTMTFSLCFSEFTSSMTPVKPLNGPSVTLTVSSTLKGMFTSSASSDSSAVPSMRFTSDCFTGVGLSNPPRKPNTLGTKRKVCATSPLSSASTST